VSRRAGIAVSAAVAVVVVVAVALIAGVGSASADEVRFQNVSDPGPDPFTGPTDVPKTSSGSASSGASSSSSGSSSTDTPGSSGSSTPGSTDPSTPGASGSSTPGSTDPSASGGSESQPGEEPKPGAFGGTGKNTVCDREKLVAALTGDPEKLSAWAEAVGIDADPQTVGDYIRKLRPVTLTRDTQVTNHSYSDGSAKAYQAVLPKGTAVLADESGKPVARCRCGNPLSEPVELEKQTKCVNCPANYQPPPPCEGKCYRPEPKAPRTKNPGEKVIIDPIAASKAVLDKCRKDKGSLEQCKTEYENTRQLCAKNPFNAACDSSVCFDVVGNAGGGSSGCSSYIDKGDILGVCLKLAGAAKQQCLKNLDVLQKKCAGDPSQLDCQVDPNIKIFRSRRQCTIDPGRPECGAVLGACAKDRQFGCKELEDKVNDLKQKCAQNPALPDCKNIPVIPTTFAPDALKGPDQGDGQQGDQGTGDGPQPGAEGAGEGQQPPGAEDGTPDPGQAPPGDGSGGTPQPQEEPPAP